MSPSSDDGAATRERLIAATIEVIVELGWGGVSTRLVAERAGVNPGVVHYHFGSIDDLRRRAVVDALSRLFEQIIAAAGELTPTQIIDATVAAAVNLGVPEMQLLFEALPPTARDPEMQRELARLLQRYRGALADRIRVCHPEPLADPDVLAEVVAATLDGLLLHLTADPDLDVGTHVAPLITLLGPEADTPTFERTSP